MTTKEIKSLLTQTQFIIDNLRQENTTCKGCKEQAIKYYVCIYEILCSIIDNKMEWRIKL